MEKIGLTFINRMKPLNLPFYSYPVYLSISFSMITTGTGTCQFQKGLAAGEGFHLSHPLEDWQHDSHETWAYSWLVVSTPLKNISQMGVLFPIYGKKMFETTNQIVYQQKEHVVLIANI